MADQLHDIVTKMVAAGEPEENIALVIKHYKAAPPAPKPAPEQPGFIDSVLADNAALPPMLRAGQAMLRGAKAHPAQAGAMIGGAAVAPFTGGLSIPAALGAVGVGAAGGAGYGLAGKALATGEPGSAEDNAKTMAKEGALGAAGEGVGRGIGAIAKGAGKLVYKASLRPSMALQREFGDVAAKGIREGAIVSENGVNQAENAIKASSQEAKTLLGHAAATAPPVRVVTEVGKETIPIVQRADLRAATGLPNEGHQIVGRIKAMQAANPGGVDLLKAQEMKGELQDLAARVYRAQDKGSPIVDLGADTNAAMARGLRGAIEKRVPEVGPINAHTQELMGLRNALENATMRNVPGVGSLRTFLGDFVPSVASTAGIGLDRVGGSPLTSGAVRSALLALFGGQ